MNFGHKDLDKHFYKIDEFIKSKYICWEVLENMSNKISHICVKCTQHNVVIYELFLNFLVPFRFLFFLFLKNNEFSSRRPSRFLTERIHEFCKSRFLKNKKKIYLAERLLNKPANFEIFITIYEFKKNPRTVDRISLKVFPLISFKKKFISAIVVRDPQ